VLEIRGKQHTFCRGELGIFRWSKRGEQAAVAIPHEDEGDEGLPPDLEDPTGFEDL